MTDFVPRFSTSNFLKKTGRLLCDVKNTVSFRLSLYFSLNCKLSLRCFNKFIAFNFFVPAMLRVSFLCCKVFDIVKVASSTLSAELSLRHAFYVVRVVRVAEIIRVAWLVYIRTYCVPIATSNQNRRSRLLYLGDAQTKIIVIVT